MRKINVKGTIIPSSYQDVYDWCGIEATSPKSISKELQSANGEEIEVEINSGGGSVFAGSEIYTALKSYAGKVTVKVVGLAASAASVIAMAGDKVLMSPTAQMMIHNVSSYASGDYRDMEHTAEVLKTANQTIANAYQLKTGIENSEILAMMDSEKWMDPQEALNKGFIDEIMFQNQQLIAGYTGITILPLETINKLKSMINSQPENNEADFLMSESRFKLLDLKGVDND